MTEQAGTYEKSNAGESTPKKRGPKTKKRDLEKEIDNLTACISKMAHFSGNQRILDEFKIERWTPGKKDMSRFANE
jgi:hypothetical protein